jgi:hypothetical protein
MSYDVNGDPFQRCVEPNICVADTLGCCSACKTEQHPKCESILNKIKINNDDYFEYYDEPELTHLDLSCNNITNTQKKSDNTYEQVAAINFKPFTKLQCLNLSYNQLNHFDLNSLPSSIVHLDLSNNNLSSIGSLNFTLKSKFQNLLEIYVHNNAWDCSYLILLESILKKNPIPLKKDEKCNFGDNTLFAVELENQQNILNTTIEDFKKDTKNLIDDKHASANDKVNGIYDYLSQLKTSVNTFEGLVGKFNEDMTSKIEESNKILSSIKSNLDNQPDSTTVDIDPTLFFATLVLMSIVLVFLIFSIVSWCRTTVGYYSLDLPINENKE